jgi:hypothetical protein
MRSSAIVGGVAAQLLVQVAPDAGQLVDLLDEVHGQPDRAGLVGHAAGDRLPDPPRGVGRELEALGVVELLHGADQAEVALLDEVQQGHAATGVALGQRHDQPEVGLEQVVARGVAVAHDRAQVGGVLAGELAALLGGGVQHVLGEHARLDAPRQVDLLRRGEQRRLADAVEVHTHEVGRGALGVEVFHRHLRTDRPGLGARSGGQLGRRLGTLVGNGGVRSRCGVRGVHCGDRHLGTSSPWATRAVRSCSPPGLSPVRTRSGPGSFPA